MSTSIDIKQGSTTYARVSVGQDGTLRVDQAFDQGSGLGSASALKFYYEDPDSGIINLYYDEGRALEIAVQQKKTPDTRSTWYVILVLNKLQSNQGDRAQSETWALSINGSPPIPGALRAFASTDDCSTHDEVEFRITDPAKWIWSDDVRVSTFDRILEKPRPTERRKWVPARLDIRITRSRPKSNPPSTSWRGIIDLRLGPGTTVQRAGSTLLCQPDSVKQAFEPPPQLTLDETYEKDGAKFVAIGYGGSFLASYPKGLPRKSVNEVFAEVVERSPDSSLDSLALFAKDTDQQTWCELKLMGRLTVASGLNPDYIMLWRFRGSVTSGSASSGGSNVRFKLLVRDRAILPLSSGRETGHPRYIVKTAQSVAQGADLHDVAVFGMASIRWLFILDHSGSMYNGDVPRYRLAHDALSQAIDTLLALGQLEIAVRLFFGDGDNPDVAGDQVFTDWKSPSRPFWEAASLHARVKALIEDTGLQGGATPMGKPVAQIPQDLRRDTSVEGRVPPEKSYVFLLTDGKDNGPPHQPTVIQALAGLALKHEMPERLFIVGMNLAADDLTAVQSLPSLVDENIKEQLQKSLATALAEKKAAPEDLNREWAEKLKAAQDQMKRLEITNVTEMQDLNVTLKRLILSILDQGRQPLECGDLP